MAKKTVKIKRKGTATVATKNDSTKIVTIKGTISQADGAIATTSSTTGDISLHKVAATGDIDDLNNGSTIILESALLTDGDAIVASGVRTIKSNSLATTSPITDGNAIAFIDSVEQASNGKISATKKAVTTASASAAGIVSTSNQTFAGTKTFKDGLYASSDTSKGTIETRLTNLGFKSRSLSSQGLYVSGYGNAGYVGSCTIQRQGNRATFYMPISINTSTVDWNSSTPSKAFLQGTEAATNDEVIPANFRPTSTQTYYGSISVYYQLVSYYALTLSNVATWTTSFTQNIPVKITITTSGQIKVQVVNASSQLYSILSHRDTYPSISYAGSSGTYIHNYTFRISSGSSTITGGYAVQAWEE